MDWAFIYPAINQSCNTGLPTDCTVNQHHSFVKKFVFFIQVYKRGLISFNKPVPNPDSVQIDDSDLLLLFPFRWNTEAVDSNYTTVRAVVIDEYWLYPPQIIAAELFLTYGTKLDYDNSWFITFLVIIEWRNLTFSCCPEQVHPFPHTHAHHHKPNVSLWCTYKHILCFFLVHHSQLTFRWFWSAMNLTHTSSTLTFVHLACLPITLTSFRNPYRPLLESALEIHLIKSFVIPTQIIPWRCAVLIKM